MSGVGDKRRAAGLRGAGGFTMVEMMVSITIALILLAGIMQVMGGSKQAYRTQEALSRVQENGRFAMHFLTQELRMAGFAGCSANTTLANVLNGGAANWFTDFSTPIVGFDEGDTLPDEIASLHTAGDAFIVMRGDARDDLRVTAHNPVSAVIHLNKDHDIKPGEILVVSDCAHTAIFQNTGPTNNNNNATTSVHQTGTEEPGNCTKGLGLPVNCTANGTSYTYRSGATLMRFITTAYFIGEGANGGPSLYRYTLSDGPEELVEGVEDMQLTYGIDNNADQQADAYVDAGGVAGNWGNVVSARVSLLVRTLDDQIAVDNQQYIYEGASVTAADKRMRRVFSSTVTLRNRAS